jgi:hypothetical protein
MDDLAKIVAVRPSLPGAITGSCGSDGLKKAAYLGSHADVHCQRVHAELCAAEKERLKQIHDEESNSRAH